MFLNEIKKFAFMYFIMSISIICLPTALVSANDSQEISLSDILNLKVESASKQAEPISEAPVPVTVITAKMIKDAGVRTLQEALVLFVPGITDVEDRNESLFAPRGIYATSQQKVLVMVNGHRINSRNYLAAEPGYGIALHNLDRIEILRGPGSSLYGNVALSGVVNLITKKGAKVNSTSIDIAGGNWGQSRARFLAGSGSEDSDLLIWGQAYRVTGEIRHVEGSSEPYINQTGTIRIDGGDKTPGYDVGLTYKKNNSSLYLGSRKSSWIEPYAQTVAYDYDKYRTYLTQGPGLSVGGTHVGFKQSGSLSENWTFEVNPYYDTSTVKGLLAGANGAGTGIYWEDRSWGFLGQANGSYETGIGSGTVLFGAQYDAFEVYESMRASYTNWDISSTDSSAVPLLKSGAEDIKSAFFQLKHRFSDKFIVNGGVRYDFKTRKTQGTESRLSPRMALIFLPSSNWEYKLSYSESFVDAPYWYRYTSLAAFGGSEKITPELLAATQLVVGWKRGNVGNTTTLYQQNGKDILSNKASAAGTPEDPKYVNSGVINSQGIENEFKYIGKDFDLNWILSFYEVISTVDYQTFGKAFTHVPQATTNLIGTYKLTSDTSLNASVQYIGNQSYNSGTVSAPVKKDIASATLLNVGGRMENWLTKGLSLDARVYNAGNAERHQGGQSGTQVPYRQAGMWYLATVGYEF